MNNDQTLASILASSDPTLPAGTFLLEKPLIIPTGVHALGQGVGKTILQMTPTPSGIVDPRPAVVLLSNNSGINGVTCSARDAVMNGIVADGISDYEVLRCEVLCASAHTYSIWSHLSNNGMISGNLVNGGTDTIDNTIGQEGIELFGGNNLVVFTNTIRRCGRSGINLYQEAGALLSNTTIRNNLIEDCSIGLFCCCAAPNTKITSTLLSRNVIRRSGVFDVKIASVENTYMTVRFEFLPGAHKSVDINLRGFAGDIAFQEVQPLPPSSSSSSSSSSTANRKP